MGGVWVVKVDANKAYAPRSGVLVACYEGGLNLVPFIVTSSGGWWIASWIEGRARLVFYAFFEKVAVPSSFGVCRSVDATNAGVVVCEGLVRVRWFVAVYAY